MKLWSRCVMSAMLIVWLVVVTSTYQISGRVIGVFDNTTVRDIFTDIMRDSLPTYEYETYIIQERNDNTLQQFLCDTHDILFIYAILSTSDVILHIHFLSSISAIRTIPVFVYDTTIHSSSSNAQRIEGELLYYMNSKRGDEGSAIADIVLTYEFASVAILVQSEYQHDGFRSSVKDLCNEDHEGETIDVVFTKDQSVNSILIQLQTAMMSREDRHYVTTEVIILHCEPEISHQLMKGAELLFHDRKTIWALSFVAVGDPQLLRLLNSDVITLSLPPVDRHMIEDTLTFLSNKFSAMMLTITQQELITSGSCDQQEISIEKILLWKRLIDESGLAVNRKLNYDRYDMSIKAFGSDKWEQIGQMDSQSPRPIASFQEYLTMPTKKKQQFTIVTVFDKPFSVEISPVQFDGGEYCPTPSVPCLKIPESVVISSGYSADIVKQVFADHYANVQYPERLYTKTCCEGLCIDLLKSLSNELQFDYQLYLVPDGEWGAYNTEKGNWTGLVKELLDGRADMVMGSFSITSARSAVISYSAPFYHSGFSLLSINKKDEDTKWFSYLDPYPPTAWVMILLSAALMFLTLGFFEWWSPRGLNSLSHKTRPTYTLSSAIKTVFSLMSGNTIPTKSPISWPGKWIQNVCGFFCIIYLSAYTANLTSSIADQMSVHTFGSIYDDKLLNLEVACPTNGAVEQYVKLIEPRLFERIRRHKIKTLAEGIEHLRAGTLDVWMHDTPVIDYIITHENSDCVLKKVLTFAVDSYGIGFADCQLPDIKSSINSKILQYQMTGYMKRLHDIYFTGSKECQSSGVAENIRLDLRNAAGMFLTLLAFIVLCFILIGVEHLIYRYVIPHGKRQPSGTFWRGNCLMFISQRMHRAIEKDGMDGSSVFIEFGRKLSQLKYFFSMDQFSFQRNPNQKKSFYDVVAEHYEREKNKPLSSIFYMKEKKSKNVERLELKNGLKDMMSVMTAVQLVNSPAVQRNRKLQTPSNVSAANSHSNIEMTPQLTGSYDSNSLYNSYSSTHTALSSLSASTEVLDILEYLPERDPRPGDSVYL